jgi:uncharacterized protein (DUF58 family)
MESPHVAAHKFSKVSVLVYVLHKGTVPSTFLFLFFFLLFLYLLYKGTIMSTFQNVHLRVSVSRHLLPTSPCERERERER